LGELVFVGMGLYDEKDLTSRGLEEARTADYVFLEHYTSLMEGLNLENLENLTGKEILPVSRRMLEEENGRRIIEAAQRGKAVLLVPGDPLIATTHVDLRIRAMKTGVKQRIVHGTSIISAAIGLSGLQNYKFGRSVTIPFFEEGKASGTPLDVIERNLETGFHTLCFLDIKAEQERYMTINEALETLLKVAEGRRSHIVTRDKIGVGIARAGSRNPVVRADILGTLLNSDFGGPPHTLIFPGVLHFMEAEALIVLADAPESVRKMVE
jgi:diphthine synthase